MLSGVLPVSSCEMVLTEGVEAGGAEDSGRNRISSSCNALQNNVRTSF